MGDDGLARCVLWAGTVMMFVMAVLYGLEIVLIIVVAVMSSGYNLELAIGSANNCFVCVLAIVCAGIYSRNLAMKLRYRADVTQKTQ